MKSYIFLLIFYTSRLFAWGHIQDLEGSMKPAYLFNAVRNHHEIRYCVLISPDEQARFSEPSIEVQVESVLKSWLAAVPTPEVADTKITRTSCQVGKMDLIVRMEKGSANEKGKAAFFQPRVNETKDIYWGLVRVVSDYLSPQGYSWKDLKDWVAPGQGIADLTSELTQVLQSNTLQFAVRRGVLKQEMFYNTYSDLFHEIGHAFGLCDTWKPNVKYCDPAHSTPVQPDSAMFSATYFHLTEDDRQAINSIFERFPH